MTVTIPYDPFDWKPLAWAKQHCPSYITNFSYNTATIDYCFGNEKEALMFLLKWSLHELILAMLTINPNGPTGCNLNTILQQIGTIYTSGCKKLLEIPTGQTKVYG
jgi:hypothetical protein